ncbi:TetR/AcrR family transcriptional regulator [Streptomyces sp. NPDC002867]
MRPAPQRPGLRERKKLKTRTAIRRAAYRLIAEQGYHATTIEQIAAAAEVSASTVVRYFPAKEDIVVGDEYAPALEARLRARADTGEEPLESLRAVLTDAVRTVVEDDREDFVRRTRLMAEIPAVRARMSENLATTAGLLAHAVADRTGRHRDDLEVRVLTATVLAALREVILHWAEHGHQEDPVELTDRTLRALKGGVRLH